MRSIDFCNFKIHFQTEEKKPFSYSSGRINVDRIKLQLLVLRVFNTGRIKHVDVVESEISYFTRRAGITRGLFSCRKSLVRRLSIYKISLDRFE